MIMDNKLVAIVGMCGSGKSVMSDLFKKHGWNLVYFGKVTMDAVSERGLPVTPDNERIVREELRKKFGIDAYAKILLPQIEEMVAKGNTVLDGLYSWSEYKYLKNNLKSDLIILAIVTSKEVRYKRLEERKIRPLSFEEAYKRDIAEIENLEKGGPISIADYFILNDGTEEDFVEKGIKFMNSIM